MRLIDADELHKKAMRIINGNASNEAWAIAYAIAGAETVETEPIKHGHWLSPGADEPTKEFVCSECKGLVLLGYYTRKCYYSYCPNCGTKMEEKDED